MKKTLSLLLAIAMLASLCTVPAWAEDETIDIPVIEEITEEELELFGDVEEHSDSNVAAIETSETDGMTLLSEMTGFTVTAQKVNGQNHEGSIESLYNGEITVRDDLGGSFVTNGSIREGFMIRATDSITIDFGAKKSFSGIRIWDSSRTRYFETYGTDGTGTTPRPGARRVKTSKIQFSDDNVNWYTVRDAAAVYDEEGFYSDLPYTFSKNGGHMNINARYIRFFATSVYTMGELELSEIAMLDADESLPTWSLDGKEIPTSAIESVTVGSEWNNSSYAGKNVWDNSLFLDSYWHSVPNNADYDNDEARTVTFTLKEKTKLGGVRLWPRNDGSFATPSQATGTMRVVTLLGSVDGTNWVTLRTRENITSWWQKANVNWTNPIDYLIPGIIDSEVKYLKVVGGKDSGMAAYTMLSEIQLLSADANSGYSAYLKEADIEPFKTQPSVIATGNTSDNKLEDNRSAFDGVIYQNINQTAGYLNPFTGVDSADAHMGDWYVYFNQGNTAWMDIDLGVAHTFSGIRIFGRWNQANQSITKGHILVSDDGETWVEADEFEDGGVMVGNMLKYDSTGDCYTNMPVAFSGKNVNITARYVRILCENVKGGSHWSWQEMALIKAVDANETKTISQLTGGFEEEALEVENMIKALGADATMQEISEAREAYDALSDKAKECISAETLKLLTDAEALVEGKIFKMTVAENTGVREAVFTLPVRSNMTIKSVKYVDTLGNTKDGTAATTVTNDGSLMTIKIAGEYTDANGLTNYSNGKNTYYFAESNATFGWTKGQAINGYFKGYFVRLVASDGIGDHFIEITFGDDTKETVNIKTTPVWTTLSSAAAIEGSDYTDEITPKSSWKTTTTAMGVSLASAFDGKAEYLLRKAGSNTGNRYESDYVAGKYTDSPDGATIANQVLLYKPVRMDFIVDTGEATKTSGIRIYPRIGTYNEDKTKGSSIGAPTVIRYWGSDDGETWEVIGDFEFGTTCGEKTAIFSENVEYRYYKGSVSKVNHTEHKASVNISELTFLKPNTIIASDESVTVDVADSLDAEFEFVLVDTEAPASLKDAENKDVAYTWANGTLTISADTVATLANGENVLTLTFSNGATFEISINKIDTTKKSYVISVGNNAGTSELVLENSAKKDVKKITLDGVEIVDRVYNASLTVPKYTLSEDKSEITIPRYSMRGTTDIYTKLSLAENASYDAPLVVTYDDDTTKTYTVTFKATWVATPEVTGTFAADEITPVAGAWKVRTSSNNSDTAHPANAFTKALKNQKDAQNWHTAYQVISGAAIADSNKGHYIDVDFGANAPAYRGIRITERINGSKYQKIVISGKNADSEEWTVLFDGSALAVAPASNTIEFEAPVSYRYLRLNFAQTGHITTDTIHLLKDMVYLTGEDTVTVEKDNIKDASFTFHMPEDAEGAATVKYNGSAVDAASYTFANGVLTLKKAYLEGLAADGAAVLSFDVTVDGVDAKVSVEIKDLYNVIYHIADKETARGTDELKLAIPEGKTVKAVKYGMADVTYTVENGEIVVMRYDFRSLDDLWNLDKVILTVTFEDESTADYNITLSNYAFAVTGATAASFEEDEIVPGENWSVMASSIHMAGNGIVGAFAKSGSFWHSAYTEGKDESGQTIAIPDTEENRHYLKVTVGTDSEATEIYGVRYYARTDNLAGTWAGVTVYAKAKAADDWTLVKTQGFDKATLSETRIATVYFDEAFEASEVLLVVDSGNFAFATAKAITFLNENAATPDAEEGEIKINVTPTVGGNVYVDGAPALGSSYVEANGEVTLTADETGFKYWLDAHTGRILGDTTTLTFTAGSSRDIKAVFADPISTEAFVSFLGRNAKSVISSGYVRKGEAATLPGAEKLYQTGYTFSKWVDKNGADIDVTAAITADTDFYAVYVEDESVVSTIYVSGGTVALADGTDEATDEKIYAYNTKVMAVANDAPEGQKFAYWTLNGNIVCYTKTYIFFTPDLTVNLEAVFADKDETVEKAVNITLNATATSVGSTNVLSVLTTRVIPADVEVIETGIIYVKDNEAGELTIDRVGETTASGKKIKVSLSDSKVSGQYKLSASYKENGITARGFVTYKSGDEIITVYTVNYVF